MSLLACLGNDAEPVRDIYLARLQASTEVCCVLVQFLLLTLRCHSVCLTGSRDEFLGSGEDAVNITMNKRRLSLQYITDVLEYSCLCWLLEIIFNNGRC